MATAGTLTTTTAGSITNKTIYDNERAITAIDNLFEEAIMDAQRGWFSMKEEFELLKTKVEVCKEEQKQSQDVISKLNDEINKLEIEKSTRDTKILNLSNDLENIKEENITLKSNDVIHIQQKKKLSTMVIKQHKQITTLETENTNLLNNVNKLTIEKSNLVNVVTTLNDKVTILQKEQEKERNYLIKGINKLTTERNEAIVELNHAQQIIELTKETVNSAIGSPLLCGAASFVF